MKILITITKSTKIVQLVLRKLVKNENFDYVINDQPPPPPPPPPVINRKHLETPPPPSADYVICERPLINHLPPTDLKNLYHLASSELSLHFTKKTSPVTLTVFLIKLLGNYTRTDRQTDRQTDRHTFCYYY